MVSFEFTEGFLNFLHELPPDTQEFIKAKLEFFETCENPLLLAKKLKGLPGVYRFRIGDYRAVFRAECSTCIFLTVKNRRDVYKGLSL